MSPGRGTAVCVAALLLLAPARLLAEEFRVGDVVGLADLSLSYGLRVRTERRSPKLVGIANGGEAPSVNGDDGTLNYDTGIASNMVRATGELTLVWKNLGAYARGYAYYDWEQFQRDRRRTDLTRDGKKKLAEDVGLEEYYLSLGLRPGGMPVQIRVGDQVVNWGETTFIRDGVDVINPLDTITLFQPAALARDGFVPQGMIWGAANLTELISVEGYYQYRWEPLPLPPVGSLFSALDLVGVDGLGRAWFGAGEYSDLGTDLDATFALPAGTLGFDRDFMSFAPGGRKNARNHGQYGITVQAILPAFNGTKVALHFLNYHSRLPVVSGFTADAAAVAATSAAAVAARAAALQPIYQGQGLPPAQAAMMAQATAGQLTIGDYTQEASFRIEYPEDVRALGFSFDTATLRTGTLLAGEVARHFNAPVQLPVGQVLAALASPIQFTNAFAQTPLGAFGPSEYVQGWLRRDRTQGAVGLTQLFGPRFGASQTFVSVDAAWIHIHNLPESHPADADSWGYRVVGGLTYSGVLGGISVTPVFSWTHDVEGVTPAPLSSFVESRKSAGVGINVEYIDTWVAELRYVNLFGGGGLNPVLDRDSFSVRLTRYF